MAAGDGRAVPAMFQNPCRGFSLNEIGSLRWGGAFFELSGQDFSSCPIKREFG